MSHATRFGLWWTEEEDAIVREFFEKEGLPTIMVRLPGRTPNSVRLRANGQGRYTRPRAFYSEQDEQFIRDNYRTKGWRFVAKSLGRTKDSVIAKASNMGVRSDYGQRRKGENVQFKGHEEISGTYWTRAQRKAKMRGFAFEVTLPYAWDLYQCQRGQCALSGIPIVFSSTGAAHDGCASLDRIDSTKGYVPGNVQWVHKDVNKMKWDTSEPEFIRFCHLIAAKNPLP